MQPDSNARILFFVKGYSVPSKERADKLPLDKGVFAVFNQLRKALGTVLHMRVLLSRPLLLAIVFIERLHFLI